MSLISRAKALTTRLSDQRAERKRLRGPADFQYALSDRIDAINPLLWQQAGTDRSFFFSLDYLRTLERVLPENLSPRYALISDHAGAPIAAVVMQLAKISVEQVRGRSTDDEAPAARATRLLAPIKEKLTDRTTQTVLVCGNLLTYGQHGVAFAPGVDCAAAWHAVAEVLYRTRQAERLSGRTQFILVKDLHGAHATAARRLERLSYRYVETEPNMVLTVDPAWKSYDDYLASLAAKYRANVRNGILKPIAAAGLTLERLADITPVAPRIHALYRAVQANARVRPFLLPDTYFPALQHVGGDRLRCAVLKRGDEILGFLISLADGDTSVAYHIGFDRSAAADLPIYLRLLHAGIEDAIAMGCRRISFGRTALAPKAALGAKPETFGVMLRHRQPVINKFIKRLLLSFDHEDAPERNPFKTSPAGGDAET